MKKSAGILFKSNTHQKLFISFLIIFISLGVNPSFAADVESDVAEFIRANKKEKSKKNIEDVYKKLELKNKNFRSEFAQEIDKIDQRLGNTTGKPAKKNNKIFPAVNDDSASIVLTLQYDSQDEIFSLVKEEIVNKAAPKVRNPKFASGQVILQSMDGAGNVLNSSPFNISTELRAERLALTN